MEEMLSIGVCRVCGTGPLGLRLCGACRSVVLLCDECDAAYQTPDQDQKPTFATEDEMPCPHCKESLWGKGARWADEGDFAHEPWLQELLDNDEVEIERGAPFSRPTPEDPS